MLLTVGWSNRSVDGSSMPTVSPKTRVNSVAAIESRPADMSGTSGAISVPSNVQTTELASRATTVLSVASSSIHHTSETEPSVLLLFLNFQSTCPNVLSSDCWARKSTPHIRTCVVRRQRQVEKAVGEYNTAHSVRHVVGRFLRTIVVPLASAQTRPIPRLLWPVLESP